MPSSSARSARINPHVGSLVCQLHWWSRNYLDHYRAQVAAVGNRQNRCPKKKPSKEARRSGYQWTIGRPIVSDGEKQTHIRGCHSGFWCRCVTRIVTPGRGVLI